MRSHEVTIGRNFVVVFDHGDDFYTALTEVCRDNGIRQGYIPMFIAGFSTAEIVGTCQRLDNPDAPVWSKVHLTNVEALGGGTLAYDDNRHRIAPHIHVTVGLKEHSATGHTSHLLGAHRPVPHRNAHRRDRRAAHAPPEAARPLRRAATPVRVPQA